ncbi:redoxin domain-containing protein [Singulisphaera sp. PoT]|uniref:redoxin domain-containing protein n=1 Tax=Singulisphaera sp. PoT TaxID=3411797 RepID=UPI003BF5486E
MKRTRVVAFAVLLAFAARGRADEVKVEGRVVDEGGKAVAGAEVGTFWSSDENRPMFPYQGVKTGADGRFRLDVEFYGRDQVVMAIRGDRGGLAVVAPGAAGKPIEIKAGPLVEVKGHFTCTEQGSTPGWSNVYLFLKPGRIRFASCASRESKFRLKVPPGSYSFWGYGDPTDYTDDQRDLEVKAGTPVVDLGAIDLKLKPLAKLYGKEPPPLKVTDARGVGKDVKLSDFKGKWVVLEFWGFWCGPCVARGIPNWVDFAEEHADDRDKFVILAVHDPQATDFAMLDERLKPIIKEHWQGKPLPLPIVLDTTGETVKDYGISSWPTAVLIDPEGKLVKVKDNEHEEYLDAHLPPTPLDRKLARALDREILFNVGGARLENLMGFLHSMARVKIELDPEELKAAGIGKDTVVPLEAEGRLTLRSCLNLSLEPLGLTYIPGDRGLKVVRKTPENDGLSRPSAAQEKSNARVADALKASVPFDFREAPLKKVIAHLVAQTKETFLVAPSALKEGVATLATTVTGGDAGEPLGKALESLLAPAGLAYVVRDEAVVITKRP